MVRGRALAIAILATTGGFGSLALADAPPTTAPSDSEEMVELGRRLFFDPAASRGGMRSCADCHDPHHGWSDAAEHSTDARGLTRRHSQSLIDSYASPFAHWDGEFASIADLVRSRIAGQPPPQAPPRGAFSIPGAPPVDRYLLAAMPGVRGMGPSPALREPPGRPTALVRRDLADWDFPPPDGGLEAAGRYAEAFRAAFGTHRVSIERIVTAIDAFCRSIRSTESPYDRYAAGDRYALTPAAVRGLALFVGKGRCVACHTMPAVHPLFTDGQFHNTGVEWRRLGNVLPERITDVADPGAAARPNASERSFKTPSLRDVARHRPYMHDGSLATLTDVVMHYLFDPVMDPRLDQSFPRYEASGTDVGDLEAFLRSLTSDERPGKAPEAPLRASRTRLRFLDASGAPLPGREVTLESAGDELPGADAIRVVLTTDAAGRVEFVPPRTTHVRVRLEPGMRPLVGGAWIPDTCAEADVRLPLRGVGRMDVRFPAGEPPTATIALYDEAGTLFPDRVVRTMTLRLLDSGPTEDGAVLARYAGDVRSDLLGVGRWFLGHMKTKAPSVLVALDTYHVETVDLTR